MFIASISSQTADFDIKRSSNTLKLIILTEDVYIISCKIYYKYINSKIHNNSNNVR